MLILDRRIKLEQLPLVILVLKTTTYPREKKTTDPRKPRAGVHI
jgi:hypothetical protein